MFGATCQNTIWEHVMKSNTRFALCVWLTLGTNVAISSPVLADTYTTDVTFEGSICIAAEAYCKKGYGVVRVEGKSGGGTAVNTEHVSGPCADDPFGVCPGGKASSCRHNDKSDYSITVFVTCRD